MFFLGNSFFIIVDVEISKFSERKVLNIWRRWFRAGGTGEQILADQLTLFQPGGQIIPPFPPIFIPSYGPATTYKVRGTEKIERTDRPTWQCGYQTCSFFSLFRVNRYRAGRTRGTGGGGNCPPRILVELLAKLVSSGDLLLLLALLDFITLRRL